MIMIGASSSPYSGALLRSACNRDTRRSDTRRLQVSLGRCRQVASMKVLIFGLVEQIIKFPFHSRPFEDIEWKNR